MKKEYAQVARDLGIEKLSIFRSRLQVIRPVIRKHISSGEGKKKIIDEEGQKILEKVLELKREKDVPFNQMTENSEFNEFVAEIEEKESREKVIKKLKLELKEKEREIKKLEKHLHLVYGEIRARNDEIQAQKEIIEIRNKMIIRREEETEWDESLKASL